MTQVTDIFWLVILAVAIVALLWVARASLPALPLRRGTRDTIGRSIPVVGLVAVVLYLLFALQIVFRGAPDLRRLTQALLLVGTTIAAWPALRDMLAGVVLKAGRVCRVGDQVTIEGVTGRVVQLGLRALVLETTAGEEAVIGYHRASTATVVRTPLHSAGALHVFTLEVPPGRSLSDTAELARMAALGSHWSVAGRHPDVAPRGDRTLEVTVMALHADYRAEVERAVREACSG